MISMSTSGDNVSAFATVVTGGPNVTWAQKCLRTDAQKMLLSAEMFIGLELSIVPEVERVFVDRAANGKELRVMVIVNERDPALRSKVYEREQEIIDAHPQLDFDFCVHARMNRNLKDVVDGIGKLAYKRFGK